MKRNLKQLEQKVNGAKSKNSKALAYYELGIFHDNNSREKEAIPNYKNALKLGLPKRVEAMTLAWLASSLYKTNKSKEALMKVRNSLEIAKEPRLIKFLLDLQRRIQRSMKIEV